MYSLVLMAVLGTTDTVPAGHGCNGGYACCGGGYACNGCNGGGLFRRRFGCNGCHGCNGGGCWGSAGSGCTGCTGGQMQPAPKPEAVPLPPPKGVSAILEVTLPADAQLRINDHLTQSTSGQRRFISPPLETGRDYVYTLRAEIVRDGQTLSATKDVIVRAGERQIVQLEIPAAAVTTRLSSE